MKKKRKFNDGGKFELSPEALAAGLSMGRNTNIRPEDREAGIAAVERAVNAAKGMSDKEATLLMKDDLLPADMQTPAGQAEPRRAAPTPRAAPRVVAPRPNISDDYSTGEMQGSGRSASSPKNQNDYSMNEQEGSGRGTSTRAPSRGSYDRPGPVGGAVDAIGELLSNLPSARAARKRALQRKDPLGTMPMKKGGAVKAKRGDGIAQRGKTKGRFV